MNFIYFINFRTREQAQSQVCKHEERTTNVINGHYMLASPSIKQMVSNKCHKHERQVNQSHASGSDNFNGAEEVIYDNHISPTTNSVVHPPPPPPSTVLCTHPPPSSQPPPSTVLCTPPPPPHTHTINSVAPTTINSVVHPQKVKAYSSIWWGNPALLSIHMEQIFIWTFYVVCHSTPYYFIITFITKN